MVPTMFVNIFLLSLLTIIYGTKGEEGGGGGSAVERNTLNFLPDASQQRLSDGKKIFLIIRGNYYKEIVNYDS